MLKIVSSERLREPGRAQRGEGGAVLHDPALLPVPPHERGDVVDVRARAGRDRGEADGRERREDRRRPPIVAVLGEERRAPARDRPRPRARTPPGVIPSTTISTSFLGMCRAYSSRASVRKPAYRSGCAPPEPRGEGGQRQRLEVADDRDQGQRCDDERGAARRAAPCRRASRRADSAPPTTCRAPSAPASAPTMPPSRSPQPPGCQLSIQSRCRRLRRRPKRIAAIRPRVPRRRPAKRTPIAAPSPAHTPIQYHEPTPEP